MIILYYYQLVIGLFWRREGPWNEYAFYLILLLFFSISNIYPSPRPSSGLDYDDLHGQEFQYRCQRFSGVIILQADGIKQKICSVECINRGHNRFVPSIARAKSKLTFAEAETLDGRSKTQNSKRT